MTLGTNEMNAQTDYDKLWKQVEELELQGLPRGASALVDNILKVARKENNGVHTVKGFLYASKFSLLLEEDAQKKVLGELQGWIAVSEFPTKALLQSVYAGFLEQYLDQNRYRLRQRTQVLDQAPSTELEQWDLNTLLAQIGQQYQASLQNTKGLQQIPIAGYAPLLTQSRTSHTYRPTLYDFLAHRALEFHKKEQWDADRPVEQFFLVDPLIFGSSGEFTMATFASRDSVHSHLPALKLYQALEGFHRDRDTVPHIDLQLQRLKFARDNSPLAGKEGLYRQALEKLWEKYRDHHASGTVIYELAEHLYQASQGRGAKNDPLLRDHRVRAVELCTQVLERFPNSDGAMLCGLLKNKIEKQDLDITIEQFVVPDRPFPAKVDHTNIDSLHILVYPLPGADFMEQGHKVVDSIALELLKTKNPMTHSFHRLGKQKDHYSHGTEIALGPLPLGNHLLVVSRVKQPTLKEHVHAFQKVQVTNLALLADQSQGNLDLRLLDRSSGLPVPGATLRVAWGKTRIEKGQTDGQGRYSVENDTGTDNNLVVSIDIEKDTDSLAGQTFWLSRSTEPEGKELHQAQMSLFLDRSIYRPGQTLYFKGILTETRKEKIKVVPNTWVNVFLYDANGEELQEFRLKTNSFGSIHGEYKIPNNLLTGQFHIEMDGDHGADDNYDYYWYKIDDLQTASVYFSVEEYKRPRFKVEFEAIRDKLLLGSPVSVKGSAQALMGTSIKNARVSYSVERNMDFNIYRHQYVENNEIIAQGETTTDGEGHFTVPFTAIPDLNVPNDKNSFYTFTIRAEVTDANGETRTGESTIRIGYTNLQAGLQIAPTLNRDQENSILIKTENLNGQPIAAQVEIEFFQLEEPCFVFRQKPWEVVESPSIEKERFRELFPHDPYDSTDLKANWKKGRRVFKSALASQGRLRVELPDTKSWETGSYAVLIKATDESGETLEMEKRFDLLDKKTTHLPKSQLFAHRIMNTDFKKDGHVHLQFSTASEGLRVFLDGYVQGTRVYQGNVDVKKGATDLKVPVHRSHNGKITFNLYFIRYNSLYSEQFEAIFPIISNALSIETLSFRNRLEPDTKETWSFKVTGADQKGAFAEVLASMYDASLDQFRKHTWDPSLGGGPGHYTHIPRINGHQSFRTHAFRFLGRRYPNAVTGLLKSYHQLEWFGLHFPRTDHTNNRYLKMLKSREKDPMGTTGNLSGLVTDPQGNPIPGASISIKGSQVGAQTDFYGFYALDVPLGSTLVFSYIGYATKEVDISETGTLNMIMDQDSQALEEVVVLGYAEGTRMGPDGTVYSETRIAASLDEVAGLAPGLQVTQTEGGLDREAEISIRGLGSLDYGDRPLFIIDGTPYETKAGEELALSLKTSDIMGITVLKGDAATAIYGSRGSNGVVIISTKKGMADTLQVEARTDLKETAFFFPDLTTDRKGNIHITFESPQALTQWRFMVLAHTEKAEIGLLEKMAVTQKDLSLVPNYPRFFREGDSLVFSTKISNLTADPKTGTAILQAFDAESGKPLDHILVDKKQAQGFQLPPQGDGSVSWRLAIPPRVNAIELKTVARAGDKSDGESIVIPVLSNRTLITESKPFLIRPGSEKEILLNNLLDGGSPTLDQHRLTLEYTSNPAWTAIKSLPYLMDFPHECAEQIFSRYYANVLAEHIAGSNPRIQEVFQSWEEDGDLGSPLEKNQELKSILLSESPWALDSKNERAQQAKLGKLFEKGALEAHQKEELRKLMDLQMPSGGFPWFSGGGENPFISRHILAGFGHLIKLGVLRAQDPELRQMIERTVEHMDGQLVKTFKDPQDNTLDLAKIVPRNNELHYMYARSFFLGEHPLAGEAEKVHAHMIGRLKEQWLTETLYNKGMIALVMQRNGNPDLAKKIVDALLEQAVQSGDNGIYWKENVPGWWWYRAPIETQALIIEAFVETGSGPEILEGMKLWLLKNKRTHGWPTTKATTEAIYALLLQGGDWLSVSDNTEIKVGGNPIPPAKLEVVKKEAGTGYMKIHWPAEEISKEMGRIKVHNKGEMTGFGGVHWQYFEDSDQVKASDSGPLNVEKTIFLHTKSTDGERLRPLDGTHSLALGDLVTIRLAISSQEELEFVHLKDARAAGLEPVDVLSGHHWQDGLGYYQATKDVATHFFFDRLPQGNHVLEYRLRVNNSGDFSTGISTLQSMYAPEFSAHSKGDRIKVD